MSEDIKSRKAKKQTKKNKKINWKKSTDIVIDYRFIRYVRGCRCGIFLY